MGPKMPKAEKTGLEQQLVAAAACGDAKGVGVHMDRLSQQSSPIAESVAPALVAAAKGGHLDVLQGMVNRGCRLIHNPSDNCCPLHAACLSGRSEVIQFVLENGGNLSDLDSNGWTSLHVMVDQGLSEMILELPKASVSIPINVPTKRTGESPLLLAAKKGNLETVRALLKLSASTDLRDCTGATALYVAARDGNYDVLSELLSAKAAPDSPGCKDDPAIVPAAKNGHAKIVRSLLDHDARPTPKALWAAAQEGNSGVIQELLCCGGVTEIRDPKGLTPLFLAAQNGHTLAVRELIDGGACVNATNGAGICSLYIAAKRGHSEVVLALLEAGADMSMKTRSMGLNALHTAAQNGHAKVVEVFLQKGAGIDTRSTSGETPIVLAAMAGHSNVVEILLDWKVNPEALNYRGETLLHTAAKYGHSMVIDNLMRKGVSLETRKVSTGETALFIACQEGNADVCQILLDHGAQVEAPNKNGKTALTAAAERGHERVVKLLLTYGARAQEAIAALSASQSLDKQRLLQMVTSFDCDTVLARKSQKPKSSSAEAHSCASEIQDANEGQVVNCEHPQEATSISKCSTTTIATVVRHNDSIDSQAHFQSSENNFGEDTLLPPPPVHFSKDLLQKSSPMNGYQLPNRYSINSFKESCSVIGLVLQTVIEFA